jgi:hypothetical protein
MQPVETVAFYVLRKFACLPDPRDYRYLMGLKTEIDHGLLEGPEYYKVAASGAPGGCIGLIIIQ